MAGRPSGSANKSSLNITKFWQGLVTEQHVIDAHRYLIELLHSADAKERMWAIEFIAKRFTIPAEKLAEELIHQVKVVDEAAYQALLEEVLGSVRRD